MRFHRNEKIYKSLFQKRSAQKTRGKRLIVVQSSHDKPTIILLFFSMQAFDFVPYIV